MYMRGKEACQNTVVTGKRRHETNLTMSDRVDLNITPSITYLASVVSALPVRILQSLTFRIMWWRETESNAKSLSHEGRKK